MNTRWQSQLPGRLQHSRVEFGALLARATTLRVGGPAECLVEVEGEADLVRLFEALAEWELPHTVLGRGSNVLIADAGLPGVVLRLGKTFRTFSVEPGGTRARAGAALVNSAFIEHCREAGLGGMEFLIAVPGNIGGAVAMNAGAHGGETARQLAAVRLFDSSRGIREAPATDFQFGYRASPLRGGGGILVLEAVFDLQACPEREILARKKAFLAHRARTQPRDYPNSGSVFKNPAGDFAGRLVEQAGLKGHCVGDAQVSEKHGNFIVNRGRATASEVLALIRLIQAKVQETSGISLKLELQVLGDTCQKELAAKPATSRAAPSNGEQGPREDHVS